MSIDLTKIKKDKPSRNIDLSAVMQKEIRIRKSEFSARKKEELYSELGILIGSGLDLKSSFKVLIEENQSQSKQFYENVYHQLISGINLSQALLSSGKISRYEFHTLQIGEETGNLVIVLQQLGHHFAENIRQRRQMVNTFSYPILIASTAIIVVLFMMNFIVPMFEELFKRFHGELPPLTRYVIATSKFVAEYIWVIFFFILGIFSLLFYIRKTSYFRETTSNLFLKIPGLGIVIKKMYLAKFCQTFALLNSSRIPIVTSIQLIQKIIGFYPLERAMIQIEKELINGSLLHESFRAFPIFDGKIISLTKVGEEVNKLTEIYENLSKQYTEEVQHKVGVLNTVLEPILIIFIGLFVAIILIAMYLPMFQMSNTMF